MVKPVNNHITSAPAIIVLLSEPENSYPGNRTHQFGGLGKRRLVRRRRGHRVVDAVELHAEDGRDLV